MELHCNIACKNCDCRNNASFYQLIENLKGYTLNLVLCVYIFSSNVKLKLTTYLLNFISSGTSLSVDLELVIPSSAGSEPTDRFTEDLADMDGTLFWLHLGGFLSLATCY